MTSENLGVVCSPPDTTAELPGSWQGWDVLRAECREIEADRSQLVASLRQFLAGQAVHPGTVTQCAKELRINMQDEVSCAAGQQNDLKASCMLVGDDQPCARLT